PEGWVMTLQKYDKVSPSDWPAAGPS
ncbi:MAG: hypothetical protein FD127_4281, partial [Acidimicrobiaceae bacterium]